MTEQTPDFSSATSRDRDSSTWSTESDAQGGMAQQGQEALGTAKAKADEWTGKAHDKADQGMDAAASGLGSAADTLRQQGEQHGGMAASAASKTADALDSASQYLREKDTDQLLTDLESFVRQKPVESVLIAAGAGFLLAKLVR